MWLPSETVVMLQTRQPGEAEREQRAGKFSGRGQSGTACRTPRYQPRSFVAKRRNSRLPTHDPCWFRHVGLVSSAYCGRWIHRACSASQLVFDVVQISWDIVNKRVKGLGRYPAYVIFCLFSLPVLMTLGTVWLIGMFACSNLYVIFRLTLEVFKAARLSSRSV